MKGLKWKEYPVEAKRLFSAAFITLFMEVVLSILSLCGVLRLRGCFKIIIIMLLIVAISCIIAACSRLLDEFSKWTKE